jgi:dihydrofolate reductase
VTGRQIVANLATSADGFIARPDGSVDWLDRPQPAGAYQLPAFLRAIDTVIMGRVTWERGRDLGGALVEGKRNIVLSRTLQPFAIPGAAVQNIPAARLAEELRADKGRDVWLMGGAQVFSEFLAADCLDQLVIHVVPVLIGTGIPLLDAVPRTVELALRSTRKFPDGVVRLHYDLKREPDLTETDAGAARATATD